MTEQLYVMLDDESIRFFSKNDEAALFEWLKKISMVNQVLPGAASGLVLQIRAADITQEDVYELLGLYQRYDIDMSSLVVLEQPAFSGWFRDKRKYWYLKVFGNQDASRKHD